MFKTAYNFSTCVLSFSYLIFILNPIQMASAFVRPFSKSTCRAMNRWCATSLWSMWVSMAEKSAKIKVRFTGDTVPRGENAILVCNHQSMADVMLLLCFAWRCGRLGDMKFYVKDIIKYFPGVGWGMYFLDMIYVKRNWAKDKGGIKKLFAKYIDEKIPLFLVSFLEGTRVTPPKLEKAQAFAKERGKYVPQYSLVPRTKGFVATVAGLGEYVDAVYDITIGYPGGIKSLMDCYLHKVDRVEVHVRRYDATEFTNKSEAELNQWVFDRFQEKDERLAAFQQTGSFEGEDTYPTIAQDEKYVVAPMKAS